MKNWTLGIGALACSAVLCAEAHASFVQLIMLKHTTTTPEQTQGAAREVDQKVEVVRGVGVCAKQGLPAREAEQIVRNRGDARECAGGAGRSPSAGR